MVPRQGDHAEARAKFADSLLVLREGHDQWDLPLLLLTASGRSQPAAENAAGPVSCSEPRRNLLPATDALLHVTVPYDLPTPLATARAGGNPAAFGRGLAEGQRWDIDTAVAAGLATKTADQHEHHDGSRSSKN